MYLKIWKRERRLSDLRCLAFVVACRGRDGGMEGGREGVKYRVNKVARSFALLVSTFFVFLLLVWFAAS